jgi:hypothetical protein
MKHLQRASKTSKTLKHMFATCAFSVMSPCFLNEWRLIVVELDTGAEVGGGA